MTDRLDAMRMLIDVCDFGGFSAAARHHGISASSVTRAVVELERRLGVQLLHRTTRSVAMTSAGSAFVSHAREILLLTDAAERAVSVEGDVLAGELRITAPVVFGRLHLSGVIARFVEDHPEVRVELLLSNRFEALIEQRIDVAIRIGFLADSRLLTRSLGRVHRSFAASPKYLAGRGTPATPHDLASHDLITFEGAAGRSAWPFRMDGIDAQVPISPRVWCDNADVAIATAAAGGGIVAVLSYQIAEFVRSGGLVPILSEYCTGPVPIQAVLPNTRHVVPSVRALLNCISGARQDWSRTD